MRGRQKKFRKKMTKNKSGRLFTKTARKVHKKNIVTSVDRGGYRL